MEKFETYLNKELETTRFLLQIMTDPRQVDFLLCQQTLLVEIIYHFEVFVKREHVETA